MIMKKYEVELTSKTYRDYTVEAKNKIEARVKAFDALDEDDEVSRAWKENAVVSFICKAPRFEA